MTERRCVASGLVDHLDHTGAHGAADADAVEDWGDDMENEREDAKLRHPVGSRTHGVVRIRRPFGGFIELDGSPDAIGFLDIASYSPDPPALDRPEVGVGVSVQVAFHDEQKRQIRVRVGEPFRRR
ncbi:hypothetical protein [Streptomyces sp. NPDC046860]|uniref:hypothetical protein n=1 Tax=Streptomyces sp. NPDC046860 TaxID=3154495 RepID=UPI0034100EA9